MFRRLLIFLGAVVGLALLAGVAAFLTLWGLLIVAI
jgi:hypothetical protein